ncbi:hypothetical protein [Dongia deserti]|uniref:hypothetical protein n=1 Tax=Dongia deserti TaxID=2268030 RepID=UPI000E65A4AA|nr:hypothetical protein [Dongia deserti]
MRLLPLFTLLLAGTAVVGCSGAHDALRNEAEVMYRVPAYGATADRYDDDEVVYVRPSYRAVPAACDDLIYGGDGYYYCDPD